MPFAERWLKPLVKVCSEETAHRAKRSPEEHCMWLCYICTVGDINEVGGGSLGKTRNKTEVGQRDCRSLSVRVLVSFTQSSRVPCPARPNGTHIVAEEMGISLAETDFFFIYVFFSSWAKKYVKIRRDEGRKNTNIASNAMLHFI